MNMRSVVSRLPAVARVLLGLAMLLCAGACSVPVQRRAQSVSNANVPFGLLQTDTAPVPATPTTRATESVALCFIDNGKVTMVPQALPTPVTLLAAVGALAQPPSRGGLGLQTALGDPGVVDAISLQAGIATVDLQQAIATLGGDNQLLAVAQLVCTLTERPGVGQVSFTISGTPVDVPRADGSLTSAPVSRDDYVSLFS